MHHIAHSFLRDLVYLVERIFLYRTVSRATYETCVRGEYTAIPNLLDLVRIYLDPKDLLFNDALAFLRGNAGINL
jgi:hypothetical protein